MARIRQRYRNVAQNLRLVKMPGRNRWSRQTKRWSEAALGEDAQGRPLFVFCRSPYSMRSLNEMLLEAGIGLVALKHLEGGPEAQLYVKVGDTELELGRYPTSSASGLDGNRNERAPAPCAQRAGRSGSTP